MTPEHRARLHAVIDRLRDPHAEMCPSCHHAITDSTATLGELSPGRYDDDESGVTVRCYCACHDRREEAAP